MNIEQKHYENPVFEARLKPLFEAMKAGNTIKSVTCMKGTLNKDNLDLDFKIKNFKATDYWVGIGWSQETGQADLVDTDKRSFYMGWVRDFEL